MGKKDTIQRINLKEPLPYRKLYSIHKGFFFDEQEKGQF